jgi:dicarboxylate transporter 10
LVSALLYYGRRTDVTSYDLIKKRLLQTGHFSDTAPLHLLTATLGGTVAVTACAPIDVMKSRVQASANSVSVVIVRHKAS